MRLSHTLSRIESGQDLSAQEAKDVFDRIFKGDIAADDIARLLTGLRNKGEAVSEIQGAVLSMRGNMKPITSVDGAIDIVGTGGDGHGTLNVSTAAAIVASGAGAPVAKHGNRAASSLSGSSDVLAKLGVNLEPEWDVLERCLHEIGLVFLFAPRHHPSMRHVAEVRKKLGVRTIFNLLGPMTNPAHVKLHLIGVYNRAWSKPVAETLSALGSYAAWVTHGHSGLDEISTTGPSHVCELKGGVIKEFDITPQDNGIAIAQLTDLKGGSAEINAAAIHDLLDGKKSAYRDIVVMNAGAALLVAGKTNNLSSGVNLAAKAIDSGAAKEKLVQLVTITNNKE